MSKTKTLTVRLSDAEHALIEAAAKEKLISPSTLLRSLAITAINNKYHAQPESPSPNFDKLSFPVRRKLLSFFERVAIELFRLNQPIEVIETTLLLGIELGKQDFLEKID